MAGTHEITVKIQDSEAQVALVCHAVSDAPCRRRPPDFDSGEYESWTDEQATVSGYPCWAVEFIEDGGLECLRYHDHKRAFTYSGPVDIWYDEGVVWSEEAKDEPLPIGADS